MLALGFALGWVAKPAATDGKSSAGVPANVAGNPPTTAPAKTETPPASLPSKRAEREAAPKKPADGMTDQQRAQAKKMQAEGMKMMRGNLRTKLEKQIERLAAGINLTSDQKAALTAWMEEKMKSLDSMDFSDPESMEDLEGLTKSLTAKGMEEQLEPSLSPDQKNLLAEFKEKERKGKADAGALKSLSMMQGVVEFREGQRDEVYKLLMEDAEARALAEEENPDPSKFFTEGMGIQMDPYDLGIQKAMTDAVGMNGSKLGKEPTDQKEMAKRIRESIDQRIDERVEKLRPALDDQQLDQYRNELKTKGLGFYGSVLSGMEKSGE